MKILIGFEAECVNKRKSGRVRLWRGETLLYEAFVLPQSSYRVDFGDGVVGRVRFEKSGVRVTPRYVERMQEAMR